MKRIEPSIFLLSVSLDDGSFLLYPQVVPVDPGFGAGCNIPVFLWSSFYIFELDPFLLQSRPRGGSSLCLIGPLHLPCLLPP